MTLKHMTFTRNQYLYFKILNIKFNIYDLRGRYRRIYKVYNP